MLIYKYKYTYIFILNIVSIPSSKNSKKKDKISTTYPNSKVATTQNNST